MDRDKVVGTLIQTLQRSDLSELAVDISDKLLSDVPVFGALRKLWKSGQSVSEYLFMRQVARFLFELKDMSVEERQEKLARLSVDSQDATKTGENILLLLDRMNHVEKPAMAARVFRAYLEERIDFRRMQRLNHAIDSLDVSHVPLLQDFYDGKLFRDEGGRVTELVESEDDMDGGLHHLALCGLLFAQHGRGGLASLRGGFKRNNLGRDFLEIVFQWKPPLDDRPKKPINP